MDDFRRRLIINLSLALGIVLVIGSLLAAVGFDLSRRAKDIRAKRVALAERNQSLSALASLEKDFNEAKNYSSLLENILPSRDQLFDFPKELESLAQQQKIGFGFSFRSEQPAGENQAGSADFSLTLLGPESQLLDFIKTIEEMRFLVNLSGLEMTRAAENFNVAIQGKVFFQ